MLSTLHPQKIGPTHLQHPWYPKRPGEEGNAHWPVAGPAYSLQHKKPATQLQPRREKWLKVTERSFLVAILGTLTQYLYEYVSLLYPRHGSVRLHKKGRVWFVIYASHCSRACVVSSKNSTRYERLCLNAELQQHEDRATPTTRHNQV